MLAWYKDVFRASIQHQNPVMVFLTYDDEHHRLALIDLAAINPGNGDDEKRGLVGLEHIAYTCSSLEALFHNYTRLKSKGTLPYWCVHHGLTISMYYADPDGNQLEFQVDSFASAEECNAYIRAPEFGDNPVGVEFDPEDWLAQVGAGASSKLSLPATHCRLCWRPMISGNIAVQPPSGLNPTSVYQGVMLASRCIIT